MKTLKNIIRKLRAAWLRFNSDFKHWDKDKAKTIALSLVMACSGILNAQPFQRPDDKAYHVYAGAAISAGAGAAIYKITGRAGLAILGGFGVSVLAGGAKEVIYDLAMHKGVPSGADFWHTVWGSAIGSIGVAVGINVHKTVLMEREYFQHLNDSLQQRLYAPRELMQDETPLPSLMPVEPLAWVMLRQKAHLHETLTK